MNFGYNLKTYHYNGMLHYTTNLQTYDYNGMLHCTTNLKTYDYNGRDSNSNLVVIGSISISCCKSNYHAITIQDHDGSQLYL
jgi:hypothetical protein